jgi:hypothetical protein
MDKGFWLEAWNGRGRYIYDRIERGSILIENLCMSLLGGITPAKLRGYVREATAATGDDGFLPRFQLAVYPDTDRPFEYVDREPDVGARHRALDVFRDIDDFDPKAQHRPEEEEAAAEDDELYCLRFDDEAQEFFQEWLTDLETKLRGDERPVMESHLSKFRSLMPSLALLFHLVEFFDAQRAGLPRSLPVSLKAAELAAGWCDLLEQHARRIYQLADDGDPDVATNLGERIKSGALTNPFRCWEVAKKGWAGLSTTEEIRRTVGILEDRGWVKVVAGTSGPKGGRPSEEVWIHPDLLHPSNPPDEEGTPT